MATRLYSFLAKQLLLINFNREEKSSTSLHFPTEPKKGLKKVGRKNRWTEMSNW